MVVSSLIVETAPGSVEAVAAALPGFEGVEVHGVEGFKVVITIEAATVDDSYELATLIRDMAGVLNVSLVYVNYGDGEAVPAGGA